ncbi:RNA-DIRECTED DNA METHYLATION 1 isoform X2 [Tasmannia lanceolata]|uniref:RNA-DIRECTED DNA METHYLATION 1 isoform X2 n=1 Tax=Tasmannia lanceolata TaxID=3420 RepID=UPI00406357F8
MKRQAQWDQAYSLSSSDSSDSDSGDDNGPGSTKASCKSAVGRSSKDVMSEAKTGKKKTGVIDYEALSRHGYSGGLSVLNVPPPRVVPDKEQDWSWSTGKESATVNKQIEESFEERERTRAAIIEAEKLTNVQLRSDKKNLSFSQKEKRKRELGQASKGKNYVEEEKRLLRDSGVYSGFDS